MFLLRCTTAQHHQSSVAVKSHSCALATFQIRCDIVYIYIYRIALSKRFTGCGSTSGVSNTNCSEGQIRTYKAAGGPHYDAGATMAVPEPYKKQLLHFISCEMYRELWANHFQPPLRSLKKFVHLLAERFQTSVNKLKNLNVDYMKIPKTHRGPHKMPSEATCRPRV